ncbi:BNA7 [[Candida] subhashii]|uniref:Kynurenine formamidase n=1 Tax=[Candida] subhashii TaxID=561895 RepID=A0A8J5QKK1_9ASCO|nr:BNA7 [[Candida] subhashii]KAG7662153.1 BNA7 [[Candida] subhashii]
MSFVDTQRSYGSHSLQTIKIFHYEESNETTFLYIHGGAWRDPNNTFDDFEEIAKEHVQLSNLSINIIGINYRLSPEIKHPFHLLDVLEAIRYLYKTLGIKKASILGHSVGATLMLQLLHYQEIVGLGFENSSQVSPNQYLQELFDDIERNFTIDNLVFLDGIYDTIELLNEYPEYSSFVYEAFQSEEAVIDSTQPSSTRIPKESPFRLVDKKTKFRVVHSLQDELLTTKQTQLVIKYLCDRNQPVKVIFDNFGQHEQVYRHHMARTLYLQLTE